MADISIADAKAHLSNLVDRALRGQTVRITRRGEPVVQIGPLDRRPASIDLAYLQALTDAMPSGRIDISLTVDLERPYASLRESA